MRTFLRSSFFKLVLFPASFFKTSSSFSITVLVAWISSLALLTFFKSSSSVVKTAWCLKSHKLLLQRVSLPSALVPTVCGSALLAGAASKEGSSWERLLHRRVSELSSVSSPFSMALFSSLVLLPKTLQLRAWSWTLPNPSSSTPLLMALPGQWFYSGTRKTH